MSAPPLPAWLEVAMRAAPSANIALVRGREPLLVDAAEGQGPAIGRTAGWLASHGVAAPARVVCTHWHPDHVGGVAWLQREHGVAVAAHATEAALLGTGDAGACDATWLAQPVAPYAVDEALHDGDLLEVPGGPALEVLHVPAQTPGHIALWAPEDRILFTGDLLQRDDVAWLPLAGPWAEGALDAAVAAIERLGELGARVVVPGHGRLVTAVSAAVERTLARYGTWRTDPARWAWHGIRRVVAAQAALRGPEPETALRAHLARIPALAGMAAVVGLRPEAVAARAVDELLGSAALVRRDGALIPGFAHEPAGPWRHLPRWGLAAARPGQLLPPWCSAGSG